MLSSGQTLGRSDVGLVPYEGDDPAAHVRFGFGRRNPTRIPDANSVRWRRNKLLEAILDQPSDGLRQRTSTAVYFEPRLFDSLEHFRTEPNAEISTLDTPSHLAPDPNRNEAGAMHTAID